MNRTGVQFYPVRMKHSGEVVNIWTPEGANEFLKQCEHKEDFKFFSSDLKKVNDIRKKGRKKGKLNATDRQTIRDTYEKLSTIAAFADTAIFRTRVPETETTAWLDHAVDVFQEVSKDPSWTRAGTMLRHDEILLSSFKFLFNHPAPVIKVLQDNSFFTSLSALISAPQALDIVNIVGEVLACSLDVDRFESPCEAEKVFKKLEASGLLEHYMFCASVELEGEKPEDTRKNFTLDNLVRCVAFIKKRFKVGTPCGDSLRAILDGQMAVCPLALPYYQSMLKLSNAYEKASGNSIDVCFSCNKMNNDHKFMECAKCHQAFYCSKQCQRAHWKQHKPLCHETSKRPCKDYEAADKALSRFSWEHFVEIMRALVEASEKGGGLRMKDMLLEVDFRPDVNGNVPILQDPPQFKVFENSKYLEAVYESGLYTEKEIEGLAVKLRDRPPFSDLVCCILYSRVRRACRFFNTSNPVTNKQLYTEETMETYRLAMNDGNYFHVLELLKGFVQHANKLL